MFWQQKQPPSSAWSSLREGADLEVLLVFEGSDGMEKWLSHRWASEIHCSHWLYIPETSGSAPETWQFEDDEILCQSQASIQGPTLSLGGRCIWKCRKYSVLIWEFNQSCQESWFRLKNYRRNLGTPDPRKEQSSHGPPKQTEPQSITKMEKSSKVRQNIANILWNLTKLITQEEEKKKRKKTPISNSQLS